MKSPIPASGQKLRLDQIEGGQIDFCQKYHDGFSVLWDNSAIKRSIYYEERVAANPLALGFSEIFGNRRFSALFLKSIGLILPSLYRREMESLN